MLETSVLHYITVILLSVLKMDIISGSTFFLSPTTFNGLFYIFMMMFFKSSENKKREMLGFVKKKKM